MNIVRPSGNVVDVGKNFHIDMSAQCHVGDVVEVLSTDGQVLNLAEVRHVFGMRKSNGKWIYQIDFQVVA